MPETAQTAQIAQPTPDGAPAVEAAVEVMEHFLRSLRAGTSARWLTIDLTLSQVKVMFTLAQSGGAIVSEIAGLLGIGNAGASLLVDRLVRLGFAERTEDPVDRRRTVVRLSPEGADLVRELSHGGRARLHRVLAALSPEDLAALVQGVAAAARVAEDLARSTLQGPADRSAASS
jgi:DNA-binding MarR family transcriptional regulator